MKNRQSSYRSLALSIQGASASIALWFFTPAASLGHGDIHERIDAVTAEIRQDSKNGALYLKRGELFTLHQEWDKAEADLNRAQELAPELVAIHLVRSRLYLARNLFKGAATEADNFLKRYPSHPEALKLRANALTGLTRYQDAAATWTRLIEVAADSDVEYYLERARALQESGAKHFDEALRGVDEGLAKLGPVPTLGMFGVELELKRKNFDAALARLDVLKPKSGRVDTWLEQKGDILAVAGRKEEAQSIYKEALEAAKNLPPRLRSTKASASFDVRIQKKINKLNP